jgi:hypothetical protein
MRPEEEAARRQIFADMSDDKLAAVAWLRERVEHVDRATMDIRQRLDASTDATERHELERELMVGLWTRGTALERASEILIELAPEQREQLESQIANARAEQQVARQRLWGDASQN